MQRILLHPDNPPPRLIERAAAALRAGGLVVFATDTTYALGCNFFAKRAIADIYRLKGLPDSHPLAILCADLSELAQYAVVEKNAFRILKHHLPGKFTFVLPATPLVPKLLASKKRTIGVRIPAHPVCNALVRALGHPILSTTVTGTMQSQVEAAAAVAATNDDEAPTAASVAEDPDELARELPRSVAVFLDCGPLHGAPSSVVDLTQPVPQILRRGSGDLSWLEP